MTDPRRRIEPTLPEPRAKTLGRPASDAWRMELAAWNEEDRVAWKERVAIMVVQGGVDPEQAERAAFFDVAQYRIR